MTIYKYDSGSPLRNQQLGQVTGTTGNVATAQRQGLPGHRLELGQRRRPHLLHPVPRDQRAALRQRPEREPVQHRAVHHQLAAQRHPVLLHDARARATTAGSASSPAGSGASTATGADVDARLHGRLHEGGRMTDTEAADGTGSAGSDWSAVTGPDTTHHWWRLIAIWVVLSAVLDPLFYYLAGPHIPPGTMTDVGAGCAVRLQRPVRHRTAGGARRVDLHDLRHRDVAGVAGAVRSRSAAPRRAGTWASRSAGSSPPR